MRWMRTIAALGLVLALAGCGIVPGVGPDPRVDAVPVATVICPETYEDGYAEAGLVPAGFQAVAVLRCDPYASERDGEGEWSGVLLERLEGSMEPVLAALAAPSAPRSLGACPAIGYIVPELWVESANGTVVRAAIPTDGCGAPKAVGLEAALDALTVVDATFTPAALIESRAAKEAGCATEAGLLILAGTDLDGGLDVGGIVADEDDVDDHFVGEESLIPYEMPGLPDAADVEGARLCDYVVPESSPAPDNSLAPAGASSVFVGVRTLARAEAQAIVSSAQVAPVAAACSDAAARLVVVHPRLGDEEAAPFIVELDGCRRLVDPGLRARQAGDEILKLLESAG